MTNELTTFGSTELSLDEILAGLNNTLQNVPRVESKAGTNYLKLRGLNDWVFGKDATEIEADDEFAADISAFTHGYVAWHMKRPEFQAMIPMNQPLTMIKLPDPASIKAKDGIEDARGLVLAGLGEWQGMRFDYSANTRSGREGIEALIDEIRDRLQAGHKDACPIVVLRSSTYMHPLHGEVVKPIFKVVRWLTRPASMAAVMGQEPEPEVIAPPVDDAPRRRRAKA